MDKLANNWQNLIQVGLQLKFAFRIRPSVSYTDRLGLIFS